ncbi:hypothetical protein V9T40_002597 [Parthenolecanium corni]|uniref:Uncharacterized protein n=1 Tax=Parthenolecanium corni TaxID=536013 RepID=A0AAN9TKR5_9HEMI
MVCPIRKESEGVKVPSSKVRVSFFESNDKKYVLSTPDSFGNQSYPENFVIYEQFVMSSPAQSHNATTQYSYDRQERPVAKAAMGS